MVLTYLTCWQTRRYKQWNKECQQFLWYKLCLCAPPPISHAYFKRQIPIDSYKFIPGSNICFFYWVAMWWLQIHYPCALLPLGSIFLFSVFFWGTDFHRKLLGNSSSFFCEATEGKTKPRLDVTNWELILFPRFLERNVEWGRREGKRKKATLNSIIKLPAWTFKKDSFNKYLSSIHCMPNILLVLGVGWTKYTQSALMEFRSSWEKNRH